MEIISGFAKGFSYLKQDPPACRKVAVPVVMRR
jgi:hypothetical protein